MFFKESKMENMLITWILFWDGDHSLVTIPFKWWEGTIRTRNHLLVFFWHLSVFGMKYFFALQWKYLAQREKVGFGHKVIFFSISAKTLYLTAKGFNRLQIKGHLRCFPLYASYFLPLCRSPSENRAYPPLASWSKHLQWDEKYSKWETTFTSIVFS